MKTKTIDITEVVSNTGQVPGLPVNPRQWTRLELDDLKKSIQETPELLEARGIIVYPFEDRYVVLGGNMRLEACRELGRASVPCIIMEEQTPIEKLKEIVIKDNGSFGSWDYDLLANSWDDLPLLDWGVPAWKTTDIDDDAVNALFDSSTDVKEKPLTITIEIPKDLEDKMPDIRSSVELTIEEWAGCKVK